MLLYDKMYIKLGVRKIAHFLKPIIIDTNTFTFPFKSILYWFTVSDIIAQISKQYPYLKNTDKVFVKSILEYNETTAVGSFRSSHKIPSTVISELTAGEKEFKFIKNGVKDLPMTDKSLLVVNYGALNFMYSYNPNPMMRYNKWHNTYDKMVSQLQQRNYETNRNRFVTFLVPQQLLTRVELDKYAKKIISTNLERLSTYEYFNLIDLWRYLTPEFKSESLLSNIPNNELSNTTFMIISGTKMVLLNLGVLAGIVEEYGIETKLRKYKAATVRKMFYVMLYSLINNKAIEYDTILRMLDLENEADVIIKPESLTDAVIDRSNLPEAEIDIEDIITKHVIEKQDDEKPQVIVADDNEADIVDDDTEVTEAELKDLTEDSLPQYQSKKDILEENVNNVDVLLNKVNKLTEYKVISKNEQERITSVLVGQKTMPSPIPYDTSTLGEVLDTKLDSYVIPEKFVNITNNPVIDDPTLNRDVIGAIDKQYIETQYAKDMVRSVYGLQAHNVVIEEYVINENETILGGTQEHVIKIKTLNGKPSTIKFYLPKIDSSGTFKISNNTYRMRKQRADIPLRKIDSSTVSLSSYYGKVFITKANIKRDDIGYWLRNKLVSMYDKDARLRDLVLIPMDNVDADVPLHYGYFSRYVKSFKFKSTEYIFDYSKRAAFFKMEKSELKNIEKNKYTLVGMQSKIPVVMDKDNNFYLFKDNAYVATPSLLTELEFDLSNAPIEFTVIKLYNKSIPTVVFLSYYLGLYKLMQTLNIKYHFEENSKRVTPKANEYCVQFKNGVLVIERDYGDSDLILGGLLSLKTILKELDISILLSKTKYKILFNKLELSLLYTNEIDLIDNMFVDPITETVLASLKEPTTFKGLILRAAEILVDDNYIDPNDVTGMCFKGYERVAGMVYKELLMGLREHENRSFYSKSKITINPYRILTKINEDSTTVLVDDLNPIAFLKQSEDTTYLGENGRSKESMARGTRSTHVSERGIISEAGKDSGDVGITAYLSAIPKINSLRGDVGHFDFKNEEDSWGSVLSTSALIAPFATTDDVKRLGFSSIQNSHVIPMQNMKAPFVRTGYEAIIPIRVGGKFVIIAEENGEVISVNKTGITVAYMSGEPMRTKARNVTYKLSSWTSKEESGTCYTHNMAANLSVGDKFIKDDTIAYDTSFFEPDFFNPKRVIYKQGETINVALMEDSQTFEDSGAISKEMSTYLASDTTKIKSIVVNSTDSILNLKNVNDPVEPNDGLFSIADSVIGDYDKLDERTKEILQDLKMSSPKAKLRGTINKIVVYYNCELEALSPSLKEIVKTTDVILERETGFTGKVNSGYSINGRPLLPGEVEIKIYINVNDIMGIGDKAIFANQLKFTVGDVYEYNITGLDGTKVDATFSTTSIKARVVNSPDLIGTTSSLLAAIKKNASELYFGKKV